MTCYLPPNKPLPGWPRGPRGPSSCIVPLAHSLTHQSLTWPFSRPQLSSGMPPPAPALLGHAPSSHSSPQTCPLQPQLSSGMLPLAPGSLQACPPPPISAALPPAQVSGSMSAPLALPDEGPSLTGTHSHTVFHYT